MQVRGLIIAGVLWTLSCAALGGAVHDRAGTRAAAFLKMESGGRAAALAGAYTALGNDADGLFWNPAALGAIPRRELVATQDFAFGGINHETIAYAQRLGPQDVAAAHFQGLFARIDRRTGDTLEPDSTMTARALAIGASYAHTVRRVSLGATIAALQEDYDVEQHQGMALAFGLRWDAPGATLGMSIQNLGPPLGGDPLPLLVRVGAAARISADGPTVGADLVVPSDDFPSLRLGVEQWFLDQIALRAGYFLTRSAHPARGFSVGIGLRTANNPPLGNADLHLDYALVPEGGVGDAHRVSLRVRF